MTSQKGFSHILIIISLSLILGLLGYKFIESLQSQNTNTNQLVDETKNTASEANQTTTTESKKEIKPDSIDTLDSPEKISSSDNKTYFVYGAPAGQNNKTTKKIVISLPGHGTTADVGYKAWGSHLDKLVML